MLSFEKHNASFSQNQDGILQNLMFKTVNFFSQINYNPSLVWCTSVDININFYPAITFLVHMAQMSSNAAWLWLSIHKSGSADGLQLHFHWKGSISKVRRATNSIRQQILIHSSSIKLKRLLVLIERGHSWIQIQIQFKCKYKCKYKYKRLLVLTKTSLSEV